MADVLTDLLGGVSVHVWGDGQPLDLLAVPLPTTQHSVRPGKCKAEGAAAYVRTLNRYIKAVCNSFVDAL